MARIAGVDIPREKCVVISLTYIFGIGKPTSQKVLAEAGIQEEKRVKDLTEEEIVAIRNAIAKYRVEGDIRRQTAMDIKRLMEIGCFRGLRHRHNLPCRGQKTKTNARTCKGPKKTVANKKK